MSIGQLEQALKVRFGHDQHITGDVTLAENEAFTLTVRGTGILAKTFTDELRNLDKLLIQASEYIYGQSQLGLWTNYLTNAGRNDDVIQFAQASYGKVEASERPYVLNSWGNAITPMAWPY